MNNLQCLYESNADFQRFITSHIVVFEHWYKDEIGEAGIDDDIEAHNWLMAEHYDSGSDYNDGKLPDPCLRLDFGGGTEFASVELGDGTGYIPVATLISAHMKIATMTNDAEALKLYASEIRDLLVKAYGLAYHLWGHVPVEHLPIGYGQQMNVIYERMRSLGVEVEI